MISADFEKLTLRLPRSKLRLSPQDIDQILAGHQKAQKHNHWFFLEIFAPQLSELPSQLAQLEKMAKLHMTIGAIDCWPDGLFNSPSLIDLKINATQGISFEGLAPDLAGCPALKTLSIKGGNLRSFPPFISKCTHLHELYLTGNQLGKIDQGHFAPLKKLKRLSLADNQLQDLPLDLFDCQQLLWLSLEKNPLNESCKEKVFKKWHITV